MGKDHIEWVFDDAKKTIINRGEERDQADGERTIPRCVTAFNAITGHNLSNCDGWLFMSILKQCRSVQGAYKYDDYRDGLGYAALRAEEARMEFEASLICPAPDEERVEPSEFAKEVTRRRVASCECLDPNCEAKVPAADIVPPECDNRGGA